MTLLILGEMTGIPSERTFSWHVTVFRHISTFDAFLRRKYQSYREKGILLLGEVTI